jgi:hypothetical protein
MTAPIVSQEGSSPSIEASVTSGAIAQPVVVIVAVAIIRGTVCLFSCSPCNNGTERQTDDTDPDCGAHVPVVWMLWIAVVPVASAA